MAISLPSTETLLAITNVILFIIAVFLFIRLRKLEKKGGSKKEQQPELAGIANIQPQESKPERFEIEAQAVMPPEKSVIGIEQKIGTEIKLEQEPLGEKPRKKLGKKKKSVKKELGKAGEDVVKEETKAAPKRKAGKRKKAEEPTGELEMAKEIQEREKAEEGLKKEEQPEPAVASTSLKESKIEGFDIKEEISPKLPGGEPKIEIPELKPEYLKRSLKKKAVEKRNRLKKKKP